MGMLETASVVVVASKSNAGTGIFNPVSVALNSTAFKTIRLSGSLEGDSGIQYRFGVRYSQDGYTWESPIVAPTGASFAATSGWSTPTAFFVPANLTGANDYPFMQLGVFAINASGDGKVKNAKVAIRLEWVDVAPTSIVTPLMAVTTNGTSTDVFIPFTSALDATLMQEIRGAVELRVSSGNVRARLGIQTSNDGDNWSASSTVSGYTTYISAEGVAVGKVWTDITADLTGRKARLGLMVSNSSGTDIEVAMCSIRVDLRGNGG